MVTVYWGDRARTILYVRYAAFWSWEEMARMRQETEQMLGSIGHDIDALIEYPTPCVVPKLTEAHRERSSNVHPRFRLAVFVGNPLFYEMVLLRSREGKLNFPFGYARTPAEGYQYIYDWRDGKLPDHPGDLAMPGMN
jgi:hypothetical protein